MTPHQLAALEEASVILANLKVLTTSQTYLKFVPHDVRKYVLEPFVTFKRRCVYTKDGHTYAEEIYTNGEIHAAYELYPNRVLTCEMLFVNRKLHGMMKEWCPRTGNLCNVTPYENGKINGVYRKYACGKLSEEIPYADDVMHGLARFFDSNERLYCVVEFYNGEFVKSTVVP